MKKLICLSLLVLSGCSSVGSTQLKQAESKPPNCELDIYSGKDEIKRPYEAICLLDSRTGTTAFHKKTASAAIENAKPAACACGADAILVEQTDTNGVTLMTWGQGKAVLRGIRYK